jgi:hypothetical protein
LAYATNRIGASSALQSPARFALYFVNRGLATRDQMADVLRANFMEASGVYTLPPGP